MVVMLEKAEVKLQEALEVFQRDGNKQSEIPWLIRLIENPASPVALPGKISLFNHDCIHVLLERGKSGQDEAFVIGFTMGSEPKTNWLHILIFKLFAHFLYPRAYRLNFHQLKVFDLAFSYARKRQVKNVSHIRFAHSDYQKCSVSELRDWVGIPQQDLNRLKLGENLLP